MKTIKILGVLLAMVVGTLAVNAQTKTYNNHGVSMSYPSYLELNEENYSDGELNLEISNEDALSGIFVFVSSDEEILSAIELVGLETMFDMMQEGMMGEFVGAELGAVKKTDSSVVMPFTMSEDGITVNGEMTLRLLGNKIVMTVVVGYGSEKFNALKQAVKTLKVS
jgi:hypothetical protein